MSNQKVYSSNPYFLIIINEYIKKKRVLSITQSNIHTVDTNGNFRGTQGFKSLFGNKKSLISL